jgi:hypothetical protein
MAHDLDRLRMHMPARMSEQDLPERYGQPSALTQAGQRDRKAEGAHVVRMRSLQRDAIESAAEQAKQEFEMDAWLECRGRATSEAKYRLLRNHKESAFLAEGDAVLQAQFDLIDDTFYRDLRIQFNDWQK